MSFKNKLIYSLKTIITTLFLFAGGIFSVIFVEYISSGFTIGPLYNAVVIMIAFTIANAILWPIFRRFLMKFIIWTFGIGSLFINSVIFYISTYFIPGVHVDFYGFWQVPIVIAIVTTFITNITNTNYYDSYIKNYIARHAKKRKSEHKKQYSGVIMLEIDGLSFNTLKKAVEKGVMPTLESWIGKTHL